MCVPQCKTSAKSLKINGLHKGPLLPLPGLTCKGSLQTDLQRITTDLSKGLLQTDLYKGLLQIDLCKGLLQTDLFEGYTERTSAELQAPKIHLQSAHHRQTSTKGTQPNYLHTTETPLHGAHSRTIPTHHRNTSTKGTQPNYLYTTETPPQKPHSQTT